MSKLSKSTRAAEPAPLSETRSEPACATSLHTPRPPAALCLCSKRRGGSKQSSVSERRQRGRPRGTAPVHTTHGGEKKTKQKKKTEEEKKERGRRRKCKARVHSHLFPGMLRPSLSSPPNVKEEVAGLSGSMCRASAEMPGARTEALIHMQPLQWHCLGNWRKPTL